MAAWLKIALAVAWVIAGMPHALCTCGCGEPAAAAESREAPRCPHCSGDQPEQAPDQPKPCRCDDCGIGQAIPPSGAAANSSSPSLVDRVFTLSSTDALVGSAQPSRRIEQIGSANSPGVPVCALPILLGHLLF